MKFKKLLSTMLALVCFISAAGMGFVGKVEATQQYFAEINTRTTPFTPTIDGWNGYVPELGLAGSFGKTMIGFKARIPNKQPAMRIEYQGHTWTQGSTTATWSLRALTALILMLRQAGISTHLEYAW